MFVLGTVCHPWILFLTTLYANFVRLSWHSLISELTIGQRQFYLLDMAQSAGSDGGKNPLGITGFWPAKCTEPPMLWEFWINRFQWGMVAKHSLNPMNFYFAATLTEAQITDLPEEVDGNNRRVSEQVLISNLYLCLGEKGQDELHKRRPHLDLQTIRYPRMIDALEMEFKKERNETYENIESKKKLQNFKNISVKMKNEKIFENFIRCS